MGKTYQELVEEGRRKKHTPAPKKKPEKVWGFTVGAFFGMLAIYVVKYLVDFLLIRQKMLNILMKILLWLNL